MDNYSARNLTNDSDWSEMFGNSQMQVSTEQENIPPIVNPNDRTINENSEDTIPMDTVQYQLPSTENIAQHCYFQEMNAKSFRTGSTSFFVQALNFLFIFC